MNKKNEFFKETGFLSDEGEQLLLEFKTEIEVLFDNDEVSDMTVAELRMLGANMANMVADRVSKRIAFKEQLSGKFAAMSDEEFEEYLKEKYGSVWQFISLPPEELARGLVISQEKIKEILEESAKKIGRPRGGGLIIEKPQRTYKKSK